MECQLLRDEMMDVLYGEATADKERRLAEHLAVCGSCRDELDALRSLRHELAAWTLPALGAPRPARAPRLSGLWLAAAASLLIASGAALGLSGSELRYENGRLAFRLGRGPDVEQLLADQQARHERELRALKASLTQAAPAAGHDAALVESLQALVRESEARQAQRFSASLQDLQARTEEQRRYDLAQVSAGLSYLDGKTGQHVARTSELMGYVLQAAERK